MTTKSGLERGTKRGHPRGHRKHSEGFTVVEKRIGFTKQRIENFPVPEDGRRKDYYDTEVKELLVQVTSAGSRTFYVRRKVKGVSNRIKIGRFPAVSIENARKKAREILGDIEKGMNPQDVKRAEREELTLGQLFEYYLEQYAKKRCTTWKDMQENFERYLGQWRDKKLSTIRKTDVQAWVNRLGDKVGPHTGNRNYDNLRALYSWGIKRGYFGGENPCLGIDKFKTKARERFIQPEEFQKFFTALNEEPSATIRDYVFMSLLTAARKSNVLAMRWDQINFDLSTWYIPETKNGESQTIPLTEEAIRILKERKAKDKSKSEWVFPAESATGHLVSPNKSFKRILKRAGLSDLRLHDLRRTMGSYLAIQGTSSTIIGKALGHRSQAATAIYARLTNDPVRQALENAQQFIFIAGGLKTPEGENVVSIKQTKKKEPPAKGKKKKNEA